MVGGIPGKHEAALSGSPGFGFETKSVVGGETGAAIFPVNCGIYILKKKNKWEEC